MSPGQARAVSGIRTRDRAAVQGPAWPAKGRERLPKHLAAPDRPTTRLARQDTDHGPPRSSLDYPADPLSMPPTCAAPSNSAVSTTGVLHTQPGHAITCWSSPAGAGASGRCGVCQRRCGQYDTSPRWIGPATFGPAEPRGRRSGSRTGQEPEHRRFPFLG